MQLLHWTTLEPGGPSNLAAVRFSSPVNVQLLKIFGPHERIFENDTSIISATEFPESHEEVVPTVQVFFTATPILERDDKPKPLNQLATTTLHYDGGTRDFKIDMGTHSTRLMILSTWLPKLTIAVYGTLLTEVQQVTQPTTQVEDVLPITPLAKYLDVANAKDYNSLARSLCLEAAGDVSPSHLLRLMFLLKPADSDWEIPNYPARYADLSSLPALDLNITSNYDAVHPKQRWLEQIMNELRFPIHDAESVESIERLAHSFSATLDTPSDIKSAWLIHVLSNISKHPPVVAKILFESVDFIGLLKSDIRGEGMVLEKLITCAANPSVADLLRDHSKMEALAKVKDDPDHTHTQGVSQLIERVNGWATLIDGLTKPEIDFSIVTPWIYDLLGDEETFAMFLQGLMFYEPVSELLKPVPKEATVKPLFSQTSHPSLEERRAFMRAVVGLGTLFPVFCWANSEGRHDSLQRIIHAFLIWQAEPGYGDILNRILSLKQCIWRLHMTVKDCTQGTSIGAESLLYRLYRSNTDVLFNPTFLDYLSNRSSDWPPLSDTIWLAKTASVGRQGISKVLELLDDSNLSDNLKDAEAAYLFRVITRFLLKETTTQGEDYILRATWESMNPVQGIVHCLVDRLEDVSSALADSVGALYISFTPESHLVDLIDAYVDVLYLISHFGSVLPPVKRNIDQLVTSIINFETVCDTLQMSRTIGNRLRKSIETATGSFRWFIGLFQEDYFGTAPSCRFLKSVLLTSHYPPSIHIEKAFEVASNILDHLLPQTGQGRSIHASVWAGRLVKELPLFQGFLHRNVEQRRSRWILRATDLDGSEMGLGYFLLYDEVILLQLALNKLQEAELLDSVTQTLHFQISAHFACLVTLVTSKESMSTALTSSEIATSLSNCYAAMSQIKLYDESSVDLSKHLVETSEISLVVAGASSLLRAARIEPIAPFPDLLNRFKALSRLHYQDIEPVLLELSASLVELGQRDSLTGQDASTLTALLEWLTSRFKDVALPNISYGSFQKLQALVHKAIGTRANNLEAIGREIRFGDDEMSEGNAPTVYQIIRKPLFASELAAIQESYGEPRTPPKYPPHPALGLVTTSPPTTVIKFPAGASLTKTYNNNDFRQPRNTASLWHNTSRPPSTHVDEFVTSSSPLGARSVTSQASAHSSPTIPHAPPTSFIPGLQ
ncbi:hypothetical protein CPB86DRAFT_708968 [Serendipita vermifera]|nr:hypothetical protein CPB86DRAFT_708968 [Serendipita vermifera]